MWKLSNIKDLFTTIIGFLFMIGAVLYAFYNKTPDYMIIVALSAIGFALLGIQTPDFIKDIFIKKQQ